MKPKKLKQLVVASVICCTFLITGCEDNDINDRDELLLYNATFASVADAAAKSPQLTILNKAISAANLTNSLAKRGEKFTVFAPTDAAFNQLLNTLNISETDLLNDTNLLSQILTYHVVPNSLLTAERIPFNTPIESLEGDAFTIKQTNAGGVSVIDAKNSVANVTATDVITSNGVVHIIDKVILPADKNLVEVASSVNGFSILVEAVNAAGLVNTLTTVDNATIFAPTDDAFRAVLSELNINKNDLFNNKALLTEILTYHVLADRVFSSEIKNTDATSLQGETFKLTTTNGVTLADQRNRIAKVTETDIQASNGVIHVIDKVILPKQ